jgi:hypothetical protein
MPDKEWITEASGVIAPVVFDLLRAVKQKFPTLSPDAVGEIVEDEFVSGIHMMLNDQSKMTLEEAQSLITRIEKRCVAQQEST